MATIGSQDGIKAATNRLRDLDPKGTKLKKGPSGWPDISSLPSDVSTWGAYDKLQRTLQILADDHDAGDSEYRPAGDLNTVQGRIFLAQSPLDCMAAPDWMIPVCTADQGYRDWYTADTMRTLYGRFKVVETWADCRNPTSYADAVRMAEGFGLNGAWGQCETAGEFDNAYGEGCRRMIGNLSALRDDQRALIASGEVLITSELYRNVQPWLEPNWMGCNDGVGGDCIACYASTTEDAVYTPVSDYIDRGYYVAGSSSVYGVGLAAQDWLDLAG